MELLLEWNKALKIVCSEEVKTGYVRKQQICIKLNNMLQECIWNGLGVRRGWHHPFIAFYIFIQLCRDSHVSCLVELYSFGFFSASHIGSSILFLQAIVHSYAVSSIVVSPCLFAILISKSLSISHFPLQSDFLSTSLISKALSLITGWNEKWYTFVFLKKRLISPHFSMVSFNYFLFLRN